MVRFIDSHGFDCSLQQSSQIGDTQEALENPGSSFVWLGVDDGKPQILKRHARELGLDPTGDDVNGWMPYPLSNKVLFATRMSLSREQVEGLVARLQSWLESGEF